MFTQAAFKRVVQQSGLNKLEIKALYGISRPTVYNWLNGEMPHEGGLVARMADSITTVLLAAIRKKALPMPDTDKAVRQQHIARMRARLEKLPAAPR